MPSRHWSSFNYPVAGVPYVFNSSIDFQRLPRYLTVESTFESTKLKATEWLLKGSYGSNPLVVVVYSELMADETYSPTTLVFRGINELTPFGNPWVADRLLIGGSHVLIVSIEPD